MAQPPSISKRDSGTRWLLACGVGCGALVLIAVLGIVAGVFLFRQGMDQVAGEVRAEAVREYQRLQEQEKIPLEHADLFERLYLVTQRDDASVVATCMGFFILIGYLEDGEVSETEAESAAKIADLLEENPSIGFVALIQYVEENPEFEETLREVERSINDFESNRNSHSDDDETAVDEDAETL